MNYIVGSALSVLGIHIFKKGIEHFAELSPLFNLYNGGSLQKNTSSFTENKRLNYNFGKYPPNYNLSFEARQIQDVLDQNGLSKKHHELLDVYSILLSQKYHASYKECNREMIQDRIDDVKKMIGKPINMQKYFSKVNKIIKLNDSRISELLVLCYYIIEKHMKVINDDQVISLNRNFCLSVFRELMMLCEGY
jgi:hypothetical protein